MTYNDVCLFNYKNTFRNQYFLLDLDVPHVASSSKHRLTRVGSSGLGSHSAERDGGKGEGFMQFTASGIKALSQVHFLHGHQMMSREPVAQERWPASASVDFTIRPHILMECDGIQMCTLDPHLVSY